MVGNSSLIGRLEICAEPKLDIVVSGDPERIGAADRGHYVAAESLTVIVARVGWRLEAGYCGYQTGRLIGRDG